ncbi:peptidoglycan endopeptidase [Clostridium sp. AM58-1XD]|nr:peptidoglycan endopeptidase [Clostridium sp. AM58-1XD]
MIRTIGFAAMCGAMMAVQPFTSFAAPGLQANTGLLQNYKATVLADSVDVKTAVEGGEVLTEALQGATFQVAETVGDGWVRLDVGGETGYLPVDGNISIIGPNGEDITKEVQSDSTAAAPSSDERRQNLVNYALQFVGGRYRYGGSDPHSGVDCSGFTRYVLQNGAGVSVARSSRSQANQGQAVSAEQMRPGDLVFYAGGGSIDHVAMYIGNGQVVHASTYRTGIKTSPWNYRAPAKIMNVIGD